MNGILRSRHPAQPGCSAVVLIASSVLALAGCGAVHTVEPVGTVPVVVDPLHWNGYWTTPDNVAACGQGANVGKTDCLVVTVVDPAQGVLAIVPEGKAVEPARAYVRVADKPNAVFITLEDWDSNAPERPLMLMRGVLQGVDPSGGRVVVWFPSTDRFTEAVHAGLLPLGAGLRAGPDNGPTLGVLSAAELELIAHTMKWELFNWEDPTTYVRVVPAPQGRPPAQ